MTAAFSADPRGWPEYARKGAAGARPGVHRFGLDRRRRRRPDHRRALLDLKTAVAAPRAGCRPGLDPHTARPGRSPAAASQPTVDPRRVPRIGRACPAASMCSIRCNGTASGGRGLKTAGLPPLAVRMQSRCCSSRVPGWNSTGDHRGPPGGICPARFAAPGRKRPGRPRGRAGGLDAGQMLAGVFCAARRGKSCSCRSK